MNYPYRIGNNTRLYRMYPYRAEYGIAMSSDFRSQLSSRLGLEQEAETIRKYVHTSTPYICTQSLSITSMYILLILVTRAMGIRDMGYVCSTYKHRNIPADALGCEYCYVCTYVHV